MEDKEVEKERKLAEKKKIYKKDMISDDISVTKFILIIILLYFFTIVSTCCFIVFIASLIS